MNKKFVYQVGNNKKVILWCTANQTTRIAYCVSVWALQQQRIVETSTAVHPVAPVDTPRYVWCDIPTNPLLHKQWDFIRPSARCDPPCSSQQRRLLTGLSCTAHPCSAAVTNCSANQKLLLSTETIFAPSTLHGRSLYFRFNVPTNSRLNPLKPELNPICYLLALLGAYHFLHVSRTRVKLLTLRWLMSYIYGAPILDVSRSHTTTQHSR